MDLKQVRCTNCGFPATLDLTQKQHTCDACGSSFLTIHAYQLDTKNDADIDIVKNNRQNLKRAIFSNDLNAILHHTQNILNVIPGDFTGLYYNAYASSRLTSPKALKVFLREKNLDSTSDDLHEVAKHIAEYVDLRERTLILEFIENWIPGDLIKVKEIIETRIKRENDFAIVKRDVFICHRSTENDIAQSVLEALEADGHTCWISTRNLRPDDNENYIKNITQAIRNCDIFLVISSQDAMLSPDIQRELFTAQEENKKRLEYKIDSSVHTTQFKQFFDGIKWINAIEEEAIDQLRQRVFDLKRLKKQSHSVFLSEHINDNLNILIERAYFELELGNIESLSEIVEKISNIDVKNIDAWVIKFLMHTQSNSVKGFKELLGVQSLETLNSWTDNIAYKAILKLDSNHELLKLIEQEKNIKLKANEDKIIDQKRAAFTKGDIQQLSQLISEKKHSIVDDLYLILTRYSVSSLEKFKIDLNDANYFEKIKDLFSQDTVKLNLNNPLIQPYYEYYNLKVLELEKQKKEQIESEQQKQANFKKNIQYLIDNREYSKLSVFLKSHQDDIASHKEFNLWRVYASYKISTLDELTQKNYSVEEKRKMVLDELLLKAFATQSGVLKDFLNSIKLEIEEIDNKLSLELKHKLEQRKKFVFVSVISFVLLIVIFGIGRFSYNNLKADITLMADIDVPFNDLELRNRDLPITLPELNKKGHDFLGWYDNPNFLGESIRVIEPGLRVREQYYSRFEPRQFSVQFLEGENIVKSTVLPFGAELIEVVPEITKEGFTFTGWIPEVPHLMSDQTMTFRAQFEVNTYLIEFEILDDNIESLEFSFNESILLPSVTKEGHTFRGWFLDENHTAQAPIAMPAQNLRLYPQWQLNAYTFTTLDAAGNIYFRNNYEYGLIIPKEDILIPNKEGHKFIGWSTDIPVAMPAKNLTLLPIYEPLPFTITYIIDLVNFASITDDYGVIIEDPFREHHQLFGWFLDEGLTIEFDRDSLPADDLVLFASWRPIEYELRFLDFNGNLWQSYDFTFEASIEQLNSLQPTWAGIHFLGWYLDENLEVSFNYQTMPGTSITIYPAYELITYQLSFELNGGILDQEITQNITVLDLNRVLSVPNKFEHSFQGWFRDASFEGVSISALTLDQLTDTTLYAKWELNTYSINFFDKSELITAFGIGYNQPLLLLDLDIKADQYFGGWFLDDRFELPFEMTWMPNENLDLFARWYGKDYEINYILNGGSNHPFNPETFGSNDEMINLFIPQRKGYSFEGWYTTNNFSGEPIKEFNSATANNVSLYAKWKLGGFIITFDTQGGSPVDSVIYEFESKISEPPAPTRQGYTFSGWYKNEQGTELFGFDVMPGESITIFAGWTANIYQITYHLSDDDKRTVQVSHGASIPSFNPNLTAFDIGAWYLDSQLTQRFDGKTMPFNDLNLYPEFVPKGLQFSEANNVVTITNYTGNLDHLIIPRTIGGKVVRHLSLNTQSRNNKLIKLTLPDSLTSIDTQTNRFLDNLIEIEISSSNQTFSVVDGVLFSGTTLVIYPARRNGNSYSIPSSTTVIAPYAFANSEYLKALIHPSSVTSISDFAYFNMKSITSIAINAEVTIIGSQIFANITTLQSVEVPFIGDRPNATLARNFVSYFFGSSEFSGAYAINQGNGTRYIPNNFEILKVHSSTNINTQTYSKLQSLTSLSLGGDFTSIARGAFKDLVNLEKIQLPFVGTAMNAVGEDSVFGAIFGFTSTSRSGNCNLYCGSVSNTFIPSLYGNQPANTVWQYSRQRLSNVRNSYHYYIPTGLKEIIVTQQTSIPTAAFHQMTMLERVTLPENTTSIGSYAFYNTQNLSKLNSEIDGKFVLPNEVNRLRSHIFYNNFGLISIKTSDKLNRIEVNAFRGANNLSQFNSNEFGTFIIPDNVTEIGTSAFQGVNNVNKIQLPFVGTAMNAVGEDSVFGAIFGFTSTSRSGNCNLYCGSVSNTFIPSLYGNQPANTVWQYSRQRLSNVRNSYHYYIPTGLKEITVTQQTSIPTAAFHQMTMLERVTLPENTTSIGSYAFAKNLGLKYLDLPPSLTIIDSYAFTSSQTSFYSILSGAPGSWHSQWNTGNSPVMWNVQYTATEDNLEYVVTNDFDLYIRGVKDMLLKEPLVIPETINGLAVKGIMPYAFSNTAYFSVEFLGAIEIVGNSAFSNMPNLKFVYIPKDTLISLEANIFNGNNTLTVHTEESVRPINWNSNWLGSGSMLGAQFDIHSLNQKDDLYFYVNNANEVIILGLDPFHEYTELNIPKTIAGKTVVGIDRYAFRYDTKLKTINIPETIKWMGRYAFADTVQLETVNFDEHSQIEVFEVGLFRNNQAIDTLIVPASVEIIKEHALRNLSTLNQLIFRSNSQLSRIEENAVSNNNQLFILEIPDKVTFIGDSAVSNNTSLTHILMTHNSSLQVIESSAFSNLPKLKSFFFSSNITTIGTNAFAGNESLTYYLSQNQPSNQWGTSWNPLNRPYFSNVVKYDSLNSVLYAIDETKAIVRGALLTEPSQFTIPREIQDLSVTHIQAFAFSDDNFITTLEVPNTVTHVGPNVMLNSMNATIRIDINTNQTFWNVNWNPNNRPVETFD